MNLRSSVRSELEPEEELIDAEETMVLIYSSIKGKRFFTKIDIEDYFDSKNIVSQHIGNILVDMCKKEIIAYRSDLQKYVVMVSIN